MNMKWYWAILRIAHLDCSSQEIIEQFSKGWKRYPDARLLYQDTVLNSSGQWTNRADWGRVEDRLGYACDLLGVRVFCLFLGERETEVQIAEQVGGVRGVVNETENRITELFDAIQMASFPPPVRPVLRLFPSGLRRRIYRPRGRWPVAIRPNPFDRTVLDGFRTGFTSAVNVYTTGALASGAIASGLMYRYEDHEWPVAFSPLWAAFGALAVALVWYKARGQLVWKVPV